VLQFLLLLSFNLSYLCLILSQPTVQLYMQRLIGKVLDEEELLEQIEKEEELAQLNKSVNNSSGYTFGGNKGDKNPNRYDIFYSL